MTRDWAQQAAADRAHWEEEMVWAMGAAARVVDFAEDIVPVACALFMGRVEDSHQIYEDAKTCTK